MTVAPRSSGSVLLTLAFGGLVIAPGCRPGNELGHLRASALGDLTYAPAPREQFDTAQRQACGAGGLAAAGKTMVLRSPYLQKVTEDSAEVLWTATGVGSPIVTVTRSDGSLVQAVRAEVDDSASLPKGEQYLARLTDLEPGQTHCYAIEDENGTVLVERTGFQTAPETGSDAHVEFIALGDLGTRTGDQFAVLEAFQDFPFDFALIPGDVAYVEGKLTELENHFFSVYEEVIDRVPFFPVAGNHDYYTEGGAPFRQSFALFENGGAEGELGHERWYSFDWGPLHIIALDTEFTGEEQAAWLEADLQANTQPWTIALTHRAAYSSGRHGSDDDMRKFFHPLFVEYGTDLVITAHEHNYERVRPVDGVTYVVTGGGGRGTRDVGASWFTAHADQVAHFVHVEVEPDALILRAIDATGREFDTARITK